MTAEKKVAVMPFSTMLTPKPHTSINVGKAINQLFGLPMVVKDGERRVRGCAIFTEIIANESSNSNTTAAEEETAVKDNAVNTSSGAGSTGGGAFVSVALVSFVSSILVVALTVAITAHN